MQGNIYEIKVSTSIIVFLAFPLVYTYRALLPDKNVLSDCITQPNVQMRRLLLNVTNAQQIKMVFTMKNTVKMKNLLGCQSPFIYTQISSRLLKSCALNFFNVCLNHSYRCVPGKTLKTKAHNYKRWNLTLQPWRMRQRAWRMQPGAWRIWQGAWRKSLTLCSQSSISKTWTGSYKIGHTDS